jgi:hypothetical protein
MSMSESERRPGGADNTDNENDLDCLSSISLPGDFSEEELDFAQELNALFPVDEEVLPPLFVQTLLEADDPRYQPAHEDLAQRTYVRVCRDLKLKRRLYRPRIRSPRKARSFKIVSVACLLFMALTMVLTAPAFASGLSYAYYLVGHTGVNAFVSSPGKNAPPASMAGTPGQKRVTVVPTPTPPPATEPDKMTVADALQLINFQLAMPLPMTSLANPRYVLNMINLQRDQTWTDGAILNLDYRYTAPGIPRHGRGNITISEFKPKDGGIVTPQIQVVSLGAVRKIQISPNGHITDALLVNGKWVHTDHGQYVVNNGQPVVDLVFERDGVIFWITGDPRDGIDDMTLLSIADSLRPPDKAFIKELNRNFLRTTDGDFDVYNGVLVTDTPDVSIWTITLESPNDSANTLSFKGKFAQNLR